MRRLMRDPLVHFLGLGVPLFLLYSLVAPARRDDQSIVVTSATITDLTRQYERLWKPKPPATP
jgi:hypothetical protein